jgi:hypothetical protein
MFVLQQVFWLSDRPAGCRLPIRMSPDSGETGLQPPSPITAAGPPRFCTVFRNAEVTTKEKDPVLKTAKITAFFRGHPIQGSAEHVKGLPLRWAVDALHEHNITAKIIRIGLEA